ncbi:MAG: hypothetical protein AAF526_08415 [Pseudomonadota bacterium]
MSDSFWEHFDRERGYLSDDDTDGQYAPWRTRGHHDGTAPSKLVLVPARHVSSERWRFPYLQTIIQRYDWESGQLSLILPSSGYIVFIQGRGLDELDELIDRRQVASVHMFDDAIHQPVGNDAPIVTNIIVEEQKPFA